MPETVDLDLDGLIGGPVTVRLGGVVYDLFAVFTSAEQTRYARFTSRIFNERLRQLRRVQREQAYTAAVAEADAAGRAPPSPPPELGVLEHEEADFYSDPDYQRDLFGILTSAWRASEQSRPSGQREDVTEDLVRQRCHPTQAQALLDRLWQSRNAPRVAAPAAAPITPAASATPTKRRRAPVSS